MVDLRAEAKRAAARAAADLVESGMALGLGTGSTFNHVLQRLGERVSEGGLDVVGVPTSAATRDLAEELGIRLSDLDQISTLDLTIDGADEVDPAKQLIKGGGGALLREKIVASASARMIVVVDHDKLVPRLGATFRLPVEVLPFGWKNAVKFLMGLELAPILRAGEDGSPVVTDNGNLILDCALPEEFDPAALQAEINLIPGVLENGLFVNMADSVFVGEADGSVRIIE